MLHSDSSYEPPAPIIPPLPNICPALLGQ